MATSVEISKKNPDRSSAPKTLSVREKIVKIGSEDREIIYLRDIINPYVAILPLPQTHFLSCCSETAWNCDKGFYDFS